MDYTNTMNSRQYRPKLEFFHQNMKGTGSAVSMDLHPAHDNTSGSIMLKMARQTVIADRSGPSPTFARFDWEHGVCVKLDFIDLCQILQVLHGECEAAGVEGRGLYHKSPSGATRISFRHNVEPTPSYSINVNKTLANGGDVNSYFVFTTAEALGLCKAIEGSMAVVAFGIPMVIPHDTTAYREKAREVRNASAA